MTMTAISTELTLRGDEVLLVVTGEIVQSSRAIFAAQVDVALASGPQKIAISLLGCPRIDSSGMGALVSTAKKAKDHGCRIRLLGLQEDLRDVLRSTRVDTLFDWPETAAESSGSDDHGERHG